MNIYIPIEIMLLCVVMISLIIGYFMAWLSLKPPRPKKEVDMYDGLHGWGYQPLANQGQRPMPPQSEMPTMKPLKKGGSLEPDYNTPSATISISVECGNNDKIPARPFPNNNPKN